MATPTIGRLCVAAISLLTAGCSLLAPEPTASSVIDPMALSRFVFIRDELGLLPDDEQAQAEEQLRAIAGRSGVFGIVITLTADEAQEPTFLFPPIYRPVLALGGEALIAICTPQSCRFDSPSASTDGLADAIAMVAPAPEPAPGQGLPADPDFALHRWVEYVGAVAVSLPKCRPDAGDRPCVGPERLP
jgi:hypothetical protein